MDPINGLPALLNRHAWDSESTRLDPGWGTAEGICKPWLGGSRADVGFGTDAAGCHEA